MASSISSHGSRACLKIGCSHIATSNSSQSSLIAKFKIAPIVDDMVFSKLYCHNVAPKHLSENLCTDHQQEFHQLFSYIDDNKIENVDSLTCFKSAFSIDYDYNRKTIDYISRIKTACKIPDRVLSIRPLPETMQSDSKADYHMFQIVSGHYQGRMIQLDWIEHLFTEVAGEDLRKSPSSMRLYQTPTEGSPTDSEFDATPSGSDIDSDAGSSMECDSGKKRNREDAAEGEVANSSSEMLLSTPSNRKTRALHPSLTVDAKTLAICRDHFFSTDISFDALENLCEANKVSPLSVINDSEKHMPILISIEGNIGAGKTTLLSTLREQHPEWCFIDEPVDTWTSLRNEKDESLLEVFYQDKKRWSYTFQNCALLSRFKNIEGAVTEGAKCFHGKKVYITERCLDTDNKVFAKMLHADGCLDALEYDLYQRWFTLLQKTATPLSAIVYVDTDPEVCAQRIVNRNREGEDGIPLDYLKSLHKYQNDWIESTSVPTVRATSADKVNAFVSKLLNDDGMSFAGNLKPADASSKVKFDYIHTSDDALKSMK